MRLCSGVPNPMSVASQLDDRLEIRVVEVGLVVTNLDNIRQWDAWRSMA